MKTNRTSWNPALALVALVLAFLAWLVINNVTNPMVTRTIRDVPVTTMNTAYLESMGLSYRIADIYNTTSVTLRGNRSDVEGIDASSVTVVADMRQIIDMDSEPVMVPLTASISGASYESISLNPQSIPLQLEEMKSKDFVITPSDGGTQAAAGFEIGAMHVSPERITIRGPESMIDIIDRVTAFVDVSNLRADRDMEPTIRIYDRNGNEFTESQLSYLSYNVDASDILVHVALYEVVSGVTVVVEPTGEPAEGYRVGEISVTPESIAVVGNARSLQALANAGNMITISAEAAAVSVEGESADVEERLDITDYLPDGIALAQDVSATVVVNIPILPYNSISVNYDTKNINVRGLAKDLNCVFTQSQIELRVRGADELLDKLSAADIEVEADVSGVNEGQHEIALAVKLPRGITLVESTEAEVTLARTEVASETENAASAQTGANGN